MKRERDLVDENASVESSSSKKQKVVQQSKHSPLKIANFSKSMTRVSTLPGARSKTLINSYSLKQHNASQSSESNFDSVKKSDKDVIVKDVPKEHKWLEIIGGKAYRHMFKSLGLNSNDVVLKSHATNPLILEEDKENNFYIGSVKKEGFLNLYDYFKDQNPELVKIKDKILGASASKGYRLAKLPSELRTQVIRGSILRLLCGDDDIHPFNIIVNRDGNSIKMIDFEMFGRMYSENSEEFAYCLFWMFIFHHKIEGFDMSFIEEVRTQIHSIVANKESILEAFQSSINYTIDNMSKVDELSDQMPKNLSRLHFVFNKTQNLQPYYPVVLHKISVTNTEDLKNILLTTVDNHFNYLCEISESLINHSYKNTLLSNITKYIKEMWRTPLHQIKLDQLVVGQDLEQTVLDEDLQREVFLTKVQKKQDSLVSQSQSI